LLDYCTKINPWELDYQGVLFIPCFFPSKKIAQSPFCVLVGIDWDHSFGKCNKFFIIYKCREAFAAWFKGGADYRACAVGVVVSIGVWQLQRSEWLTFIVDVTVMGLTAVAGVVMARGSLEDTLELIKYPGSQSSRTYRDKTYRKGKPTYLLR
jgi:hypothetical protein